MLDPWKTSSPSHEIHLYKNVLTLVYLQLLCTQATCSTKEFWMDQNHKHFNKNFKQQISSS